MNDPITIPKGWRFERYVTAEELVGWIVWPPLSKDNHGEETAGEEKSGDQEE